MLALLLGLCSGQNKLYCGIKFIRKGIHAKRPLYIQILYTDYEVYFVFDCMGKKVVVGKPSVRFITSGLEYQIKIALGA